MFTAPPVGAVVYLVWQLFFSGMAWRERLLTVAAVAVPAGIPWLLGDAGVLFVRNGGEIVAFVLG